VRKRRARRKAIGTRMPTLIEAKVNARWSLDFIHDQLACGRRFRIFNVVDDVTRECLMAMADTSISGVRIATSSRASRLRQRPSSKEVELGRLNSGWGMHQLIADVHLPIATTCVWAGVLILV